jgi:hypothetical protein
MLADRNINRPSYVLALLLGVVAIADAINALIGMQSMDPCSGLTSAQTVGLHCGTSGGWFIDLMTSGICAILVAFLLLRPHLYVFAPVVVWSFLAFLANFVMKAKGFDALATGRMAIYFVVLVGAGVLLFIEGKPWVAERWSRRPMPAAWTGQPYPGQPFPGQYPPPAGYPVAPQQFAPPPPPPAAPPVPPAAPTK